MSLPPSHVLYKSQEQASSVLHSFVVSHTSPEIRANKAVANVTHIAPFLAQPTPPHNMDAVFEEKF